MSERTVVQDQTFDAERALYGSDGIDVISCRFDGPADGESALKESRDIDVRDSYFNLRYPFWHDTDLHINSCEMTDKCRAALWYTKDAVITDSKLHGIKALRECSDIVIENCSIVSPEFGWSVHDMVMRNSSAESEYFMMRSSDLRFENVSLTGKYSFQYVTNAVIENCNFNTKDSFWHARDVIIRNSVIRGEYLAWYCENVTFENCTISGTQPLCYCKGLKLINCRMEEADLAFEKSEVEADLTAPVISIKNPYSGYIRVPEVSEIIRDDANAKAEIIIK
ncbi:MAG: DUF3737 family protein [Lachnospiraceae bacterium]|nr:DUF3737 family protein [Lachnospiraceae bacterium]